MNIECEEDDSRPVCELTERERLALHKMQLGLEKIRQAEGDLYKFHHNVGGGMDYWNEAIDLWEESGNPEIAERVEDGIGQGAIRDMWTFEIVEDWEDGFKSWVEDVNGATREEIGLGEHITERQQKRNWN